MISYEFRWLSWGDCCTQVWESNLLSGVRKNVAIENPVCMYIYIWMFIAGEIMCKRQIFQPEPLYTKSSRKRHPQKVKHQQLGTYIYIYIYQYQLIISTIFEYIINFGICLYNVVKTIINHTIFDGLYHPVLVILGMVYYCFNHITQNGDIIISNLGWSLRAQLPFSST